MAKLWFLVEMLGTLLNSTGRETGLALALTVTTLRDGAKETACTSLPSPGLSLCTLLLRILSASRARARHGNCFFDERRGEMGGQRERASPDLHCSRQI